MSDPILIAPPAELLSLPEAKVHLRVDHDHEDLLIGGYIDAAVGWMDGWQGVLGRCILPQTWAIQVSSLANMALPFPDVRSAVVTYLDAAGVSQTVAPADYRVRTVSGRGHLVFADGFAAPALMPGRDDAVTVTAVYGMTTAPASLRVAAMMLVAHLYRNREAVGPAGVAQVPMGVSALIAPFRVGLV
jgi:uncharacterized phiE125 gp8 family phage protein